MHSPARQTARESRIAILKEQNLSTVRSAVVAVAAFSNRIGILATSFLVFVVLPAVISLFYLTLFASNQYESELRFVVRASEANASSTAITDALSALSTITGTKSTTQDAYIVSDYIRSLALIEDIGGKPEVMALYSRPGVDWVSRLKRSASLEDTLLYWRKKVTVAIDTQSTILTVRALAFTPNEAHELAKKILAKSEALVNQMSVRSRADAYARAEAEVQRALQRLATLRTALEVFRNRSKTIDPTASALSVGETLAALNRERITLEANRMALQKTLLPDSPTVRHISSQIESLEQQIKLLQTRLTGDSKGLETASAQIADYEDLKLQSQFSEKLLELSQASMERARAEIDKQQLYLVTIVEPTVPEERKYPRLFIGTLMIFAICLILWSMIALVVASLYDHATG